MNNEGRCEFYYASRSQRESERKRGLGDLGTKGYEQMGCYECSGHERSCSGFYNSLDGFVKDMRKENWDN